MKSLLLNLTLLIVLSVCSTVLMAQSQVTLYLQTGIITGSPMGALSEIPEGATGAPGIGMNAGFEFKVRTSDRFSVNAGALYAQKSNQFQTPVTGKYNIADGILGIKLPFPVNVKYKGEAEGVFSNHYIDLPLYLGIQAGRRFSFNLGYQYSYLLNGRLSGLADVKALLLNFKDQEFDESHLINKNDQAAIGGVHYRFANRLEMRLRFSYGISRVFSRVPEGMSNMRNLYMGAMLAYGLKL